MSNPIDRALKASLAIRQAHATGGEVDQFQDTPENRQRLRELGSRNYENGYKSLSPDEKSQYDQLTRGYNFPPEVSEGIHTYEDYVANELQYLQRNLQPERLTESYAEGGAVDEDIRAYEARRDAVRQQSPEIQGMTHLGEKPMRPVTIDGGYTGKGREVGRAAYDVAGPISGIAQFGYDMKTLPLYATPLAPVAAASDMAEGVIAGDPVQAALSVLGFKGPVAKYAAGTSAGAATMSPTEAKASFAGPLSKTADQAALAAARFAAERAARNGPAATASEGPSIWRRLGWGKPAGTEDWVYEIGDQNARMNPIGVEQMRAGGQDMRVGDVLHHPKLFDAYPSSFDTSLVTRSRAFDNPNLRGFYDDGYDGVGLRPDLDEKRQLETLLHELQHRHQRIEGHQPGGSPDLFPDERPALTQQLSAMSNMAAVLRMQDSQGMKFWDAFDIIGEKLPIEERQLISKMQREGLTDPAALSSAMEEVTQRLNKLQNEPTPFDKYRSLVGEQMAEMPAARLNMTDDQRRMSYPLDLPKPLYRTPTPARENPDSEVWPGFKAALEYARKIPGRASGGKLVSSIMDEVIAAVGNIGKTPSKPAQVKVPGLGLIDAAPIPSLQGAADSYMSKMGRPGEHHIQRYPAFNEDFARRVAESFEALKHDPENPAVRRAYDAMIDETMGQYKAVKESGLDVRFLKDGQPDPYAASPSLGYDDIQRNGRLFVFPTDNGFGSNSLFDAAGNPLLKGVGKVGDKSDAVANDAFRVVHDVFGHFGPGNPFFRAPGEERAYQNHSKMYSPEARGAMAMETRGQNSWVNYGPHGEKNRTASGGDTVYADQKINVLPEWAQEMPPEKAGGGSIVQKALRKLSELGFYSHGSEAAQALKQGKGEPAQMKQMLLKQGVKPAELDHAGYDVLTQDKGTITRDEIAEMLQERMPRVEETVKGLPPRMNENVPPAKYEDYTLPNGTDYRERLLTLNRANPKVTAIKQQQGEVMRAFNRGEISEADFSLRNRELMQQELALSRADRAVSSATGNKGTYESNHWDKPNVLAHMRHNQRYDTSGNPTFHVEEMQSDWAQDGRKNGFLPKNFDPRFGSEDPDGRVPLAPFVGSTQGWTDLTVKRALRLAAEQDRSAITWPTGRQQADRFGLEQRFSKLEWNPQTNLLMGYDPMGAVIVNRTVSRDSLPGFVGQDIASRMLANDPVADRGYQLFQRGSDRAIREEVHPTQDSLWSRYNGFNRERGNIEARPVDRMLHRVEGDGLKMGGEGMAGYYDGILPKRFQEVARKFDPNARAQPFGHRTDLDDGWGTSKEIDIHGMPLSNELKDKVLQGIPLFADGGAVEPQGGDVDALMDYAASLPQKDPSLLDRAMGVISQLNPVGSAEAAPFDSVVRGATNLAKKFGKPTVTGADKSNLRYPGIYSNPRDIVDEAATRIAPRSPALPEVFGVTRDDLYDMGAGIKGNMEPQLNGAKNPKGSAAVDAIMNKRNESRIIDILGEAERHPELTKGMDAWYEMFPVYQRFVEIYGPEEGAKKFNLFNHSTGMMSPASEVTTEINRGTAAYALNEQGRINDFLRFGGLSASERPRNFPADMEHVIAHPYHRTAHTEPLLKFLETGKIQSAKPKVPLYVQASGVPATGFQTKLPVPDAHFTRAIGLPDARHNTKTPDKSMSMSELQQAGPWFRDRIASKVGLEAVPAQARLWGAASGQTGVTSPIGSPKIEMLADHIMDMARRHGMSPQDARDALIRGEKFNTGGAVSALAIARRLSA